MAALSVVDLEPGCKGSSSVGVDQEDLAVSPLDLQGPTSTGVWDGQWCGREERSSRPASPSARKRLIQRCAHCRETPGLSPHERQPNPADKHARRVFAGHARSAGHYGGTRRPPDGRRLRHHPPHPEVFFTSTTRRGVSPTSWPSTSRCPAVDGYPRVCSSLPQTRPPRNRQGRLHPEGPRSADPAAARHGPIRRAR